MDLASRFEDSVEPNIAARPLKTAGAISSFLWGGES